MMAAILSLLGQAEDVNYKADLYPHWQELAVGALAFAILFFFIWKWVLPRVNALLDERRQKIQGELEKAEETRRTADQELADYRTQLAGGREESNRIIEEARRTAGQLRADIEARAERDRVFQELRAEVAGIAVGLAGRVVGQSLDPKAHQRLIDEYIDEVAGNGKS